MKKVTSGLRTFLRTYHISIMEFPITRIYSYNRSHSSILFSSTLTFPVTIFHRLFTCHEQHEGSRSRSMIYGLSYLNTWDHLALPPPSTRFFMLLSETVWWNFHHFFRFFISPLLSSASFVLDLHRFTIWIWKHYKIWTWFNVQNVSILNSIFWPLQRQVKTK